MERKEPTLSGSSNNERVEPAKRRSTAPNYAEPKPVRAESAPTRTATAPEYHVSAGPLPAIALVVALLGVAGASYFGWKLTEAQAALLTADSRITQLENQLNVTSSESTATVGTLQVKLIAVDTEVKKLWEVSRKTVADNADKFSGVNKSIEAAKDAAKKDIAELKTIDGLIRQDVLAQKANADELLARLGAQENALVDQRKRIQDVSASVTAALSQVKSAEGLTARIIKAEEAIDAIDDNRRIINRDLAQLKQAAGIR